MEKYSYNVHVNLTKHDAFNGSLTYGCGIENYMNDAPVDVGLLDNNGRADKPISGKPLPVTGTCVPEASME